MEVKLLLPSIAKRKPVQSSQLRPDQKMPVVKDLVLNCSQIKEAENNHYSAIIEGSKGVWYFYKPHVQVDWGNLITWHHFEKSFPYAQKRDLNIYFEPVNKALAEFEINTVQRIAAFLAQIAHETCSLKYKEEIASGSAYEYRKDLGNVNPGDGRRYKGRGLIQLTGRHNYSWASEKLGCDLVNQPNLALEPDISARIAALYWDSRNLNKYADWNNIKGFRIITRRINGGYNGWNDRLKHWGRIRKVLCC